VRGHVRRRGAKWVAVIVLPVANGKRKQKWLTRDTRKEVERAMAEALARIDRGAFIEPTKKILSIYLDEWLADMRRTIRPSTYSTYETVVRTQIKPRIGSVPLQGLSSFILNALYEELLASGRKDGKGGLSPASVRYVHSLLRKALNDAVRENLVPRNVADAARPPRVPGGMT